MVSSLIRATPPLPTGGNNAGTGGLTAQQRPLSPFHGPPPPNNPAVSAAAAATTAPAPASATSASASTSASDAATTAATAAALSAVPLIRLARLSPSDIAALARHTTTQRFPPGVPIITQGERGRHLYLLRAGTVTVEHSGCRCRPVDADGNPVVVTELANPQSAGTAAAVAGAVKGYAHCPQHCRPVAVLSAGAYFGEAALLRPVPRTATVRATGAETVECYAIARRVFLLLFSHLDFERQYANEAVGSGGGAADGGDASNTTTVSDTRSQLQQIQAQSRLQAQYQSQHLSQSQAALAGYQPPVVPVAAARPVVAAPQTARGGPGAGAGSGEYSGFGAGGAGASSPLRPRTHAPHPAAASPSTHGVTHGGGPVVPGTAPRLGSHGAGARRGSYQFDDFSSKELAELTASTNKNNTPAGGSAQANAGARGHFSADIAAAARAGVAAATSAAVVDWNIFSEKDNNNNNNSSSNNNNSSSKKNHSNSAGDHAADGGFIDAEDSGDAIHYAGNAGVSKPVSRISGVTASQAAAQSRSVGTHTRTLSNTNVPNPNASFSASFDSGATAAAAAASTSANASSAEAAEDPAVAAKRELRRLRIMAMQIKDEQRRLQSFVAAAAAATDPAAAAAAVAAASEAAAAVTARGGGEHGYGYGDLNVSVVGGNAGDAAAAGGNVSGNVRGPLPAAMRRRGSTVEHLMTSANYASLTTPSDSAGYDAHGQFAAHGQLDGGAFPGGGGGGGGAVLAGSGGIPPQSAPLRPRTLVLPSPARKVVVNNGAYIISPIPSGTPSQVQSPPAPGVAAGLGAGTPGLSLSAATPGLGTPGPASARLQPTGRADVTLLLGALDQAVTATVAATAGVALPLLDRLQLLRLVKRMQRVEIGDTCADGDGQGQGGRLHAATATTTAAASGAAAGTRVGRLSFSPPGCSSKVTVTVPSTAASAAAAAASADSSSGGGGGVGVSCVTASGAEAAALLAPLANAFVVIVAGQLRRLPSGGNGAHGASTHSPSHSAGAADVSNLGRGAFLGANTLLTAFAKDYYAARLPPAAAAAAAATAINAAHTAAAATNAGANGAASGNEGDIEGVYAVLHDSEPPGSVLRAHSDAYATAAAAAAASASASGNGSVGGSGGRERKTVLWWISVDEVIAAMREELAQRSGEVATKK